ncbi:MAG: hypothetical protein V4713_18910 [Pseudomonadota bacterium]
MTLQQGRFVFGDEADAIAYWKDKEFKKFAVDVTAGPVKRPTFSRTIYVTARNSARAIICAKDQPLSKPPRGARYTARLAGPRELGCTPTPSTI